MTSIRLPHVQEYRDRQGKARRYFRRPGYKRVPLPGTPGAPQFMAAYQAALAAERPPIGRRHHWQFMGWMDELSWRGSSSKRPRQESSSQKPSVFAFGSRRDEQSPNTHHSDRSPLAPFVRGEDPPTIAFAPGPTARSLTGRGFDLSRCFTFEIR